MRNYRKDNLKVKFVKVGFCKLTYGKKSIVIRLFGDRRLLVVKVEDLFDLASGYLDEVGVFELI